MKEVRKGNFFGQLRYVHLPRWVGDPLKGSKEGIGKGLWKWVSWMSPGLWAASQPAANSWNCGLEVQGWTLDPGFTHTNGLLKLWGMERGFFWTISSERSPAHQPTQDCSGCLPALTPSSSVNSFRSTYSVIINKDDNNDNSNSSYLDSNCLLWFRHSTCMIALHP